MTGQRSDRGLVSERRGANRDLLRDVEQIAPSAETHGRGEPSDALPPRIDQRSDHHGIQRIEQKIALGNAEGKLIFGLVHVELLHRSAANVGMGEALSACILSITVSDLAL